MSDVLSLAREVKLIRSGLPINELIERSKLVDRLNKQFGEVKTDIKKFERVSTDAAKEAKNATKQARTFGEQLKRDGKRFAEDIKKNTKGIQDAYDKINKPLERVTKGLDKILGAASFALGLAGVGISLMALKSSERNQAAFDRQVDRLQRDMSKELGYLYTLKTRIDKANKRTDVLEKEADLASEAIKRNKITADAAKKQANDITYEARVKLARLNDIVAQANSNASKALVQNTALKSTVVAVETKIKTIEVRATTIAADVQQVKVGIKLVDSKATTAITTVQQFPAKVPALVSPVVNNAIAPLKPQIQQAQQAALKAEAENPPQNQRIAALEGKVQALQNVPKTNTPTSNTPTINTPTINRAEVNQAVNQSLTNIGILPRLKAAETTANTALQVASAPRPNIEPIGASALAIGTNNTAAIDKLNREVQQLKAPNLLEPRLTTVEAKVKERERVDAAANQKLDQLISDRSKLEQILIASGGIALMAPTILNSLKPDIQALPGTTAAAVAAAPCNGAGCGGRTARRVDDLAGEMGALRNQVNSLPNTVGNVINAGNAAANATQLSALGRIERVVNQVDSKLGVTQLAGGISGMIDKIVKNSAVDKALQVATFMATLHNAYFLSSNLGQTFFSLSSNGINLVLRTMGIQSADDSPIDVGQIINQKIDELAKETFGVSQWQGIKREWAQWSRVYQSGANVLFSVQGMFDAARQIQEWTAENTGKIGNSLKKWGVVGEKAFGWMPERINAASVQQRNFDRFLQGVQGLEETASSLDTVIGAGTSLLDSATQFNESRAAFDKSLKEANAKERPDNDPVKATVEASKLVSVGATVTDADESKPEVA